MSIKPCVRMVAGGCTTQLERQPIVPAMQDCCAGEPIAVIPAGKAQIAPQPPCLHAPVAEPGGKKFNSGKKGLDRFYDTSKWKFRIVKTGHTLSTGTKTPSSGSKKNTPFK